ncbi:MAG TPA: hypothetical protein VGA78_11965 [Gemmatimonadales bacterium]
MTLIRRIDTYKNNRNPEHPWFPLHPFKTLFLLMDYAPSADG